MQSFKNVVYRTVNIFHWVCTIIGAIVLVGLLKWLLRSCYYNHKPESVLYGNWSKVDSDDGYNDHILTFDWYGQYCNSNIGVWNYKYIEPDSLILYHHGLYEERYKILNLTEDSLTIKLSESIFYAVDKGEETEAPYGDGSMPTYTYTRINHRVCEICDLIQDCQAIF